MDWVRKLLGQSERQDHERWKAAGEIAVYYPLSVVAVERHLRLLNREDWAVLPTVYSMLLQVGFEITDDRVMRLMPYVRPDGRQ